MGYKGFDWFSWGLSLLFFSLIGFILYVCGYPLGEYCGLSVSEVFCLDVVSLYLILLSVLLCVSLLFFISDLSLISIVLLLLSVSCSVLCYCCVNLFWFWCFYEVSILSLLVLLVVESPYSERYVASWYFLGYVLLSSLPMLFCLVYLSVVYGSLNFGYWSVMGELSFSVLLVLCVLFISKIPLIPFHVWLPLVHAEASSPVSVCLSGYIMKLGILGLCRVCSWVLPHYVFHLVYLIVCMLASVFFFLSAWGELDGKRWLAFLSLAHISIFCVCLGIAEFDEVELALLYSLGHGLSAGLVFIMLWILYEMVGSCNWFMLKSLVFGGLFFGCLLVGSLCVVMSFPPTFQFFCEVYVFVGFTCLSYVFFFFLGCYIFLGGLVPLMLLGGLITRHVSLRCYIGDVFGRVVSIFYLLFVCLVLFLFV
uniref:NADH-ubiquinone oxidoreductase chain 4 n=1 Tax=Brachylecithum sp. PakAb2 TaxID=2714092 RepID=A0A6H0YB76_9TREM|nr:NADH dehydrogenase subunit 4 [Brachylecithum sp. PakAb2]